MIRLSPDETAALDRLVEAAYGTSGQSAKVANFLLAWWNAEECGKFDPTEVWGLDETLALDVVTVFGAIVMTNAYPDRLGYGQQFERIVRSWRKELIQHGG